MLFADSEQAWCDSTSTLSPHGQNPGDSHKKYPRSGKTMDKETLAVTAVSPQFALGDCPGKDSVALLWAGENHVDLTLVCWEIFLSWRGALAWLGGCVRGAAPASWASSSQTEGWKLRGQSWWWWQGGATAGPLLFFCLGIPWERRHRWENHQRAPVQLTGALRSCGNKKKDAKLLVSVISAEGHYLISVFRSYCSHSTFFKKTQNATVPQFSTQSFVWLGNLVSLKFPAMWNPKIRDSSIWIKSLLCW